MAVPSRPAGEDRRTKPNQDPKGFFVAGRLLHALFWAVGKNDR